VQGQRPGLPEALAGQQGGGGFADAFLGLLRQPGLFSGKSTASFAGRPSVRLRSAAGSCDVAASGKPYPLRLDLQGGGQVELSDYDQPLVVKAPSGALKAS
jgi:hypothetical protein